MFNVTSVKEAGAIVDALEAIKDAMEGGYPEPTAATDGQVLTADGDGGASWEDVDALPASTSVDEGKVLTVDSNGDAGWETPTGKVPDTTGVTNGYVLTNNSGTPTWAAASGGGGSTIYRAVVEVTEDEKSGTIMAGVTDPNVTSNTRVLAIYGINDDYYSMSTPYHFLAYSGGIYIAFNSMPSYSTVEVYYATTTQVLQP